MTGPNPILEDLERVWDHTLGTFVHRIHHHQPPAEVPATMARAGAATQQEETVSVITDIEDGWNTAKGELVKFEQALPGALAKAKAFEASPFAQLAEKTAASVLPPEAVTIAVNAADKVIDDLISLYTPAQAQQGAPAQ